MNYKLNDIVYSETRNQIEGYRFDNIPLSKGFGVGVITKVYNNGSFEVTFKSHKLPITFTRVGMRYDWLSPFIDEEGDIKCLVYLKGSTFLKKSYGPYSLLTKKAKKSNRAPVI
jgi:hypothetical protein